MFKNYIKIARPSHWFKNLLMIPGVVFGILIIQNIPEHFFIKCIIAAVSVCLITSANYTINEWLDADLDRFHPLKKNRPSVLGQIKSELVLLQYILLSVLGLFFAYFISINYFIVSAILLFMGFLYNVKPFRTKDKPYLDVLSESINSPIRLMLGWYIVVGGLFLPVSFVIAYWMGGAFLMAVKRYAELRLIRDKSIATLYRKSFGYYTENNLLISIVFYAMCFAFFFGIFMIKHRIGFVVSFPLFALLFTWYLKIGMNENSVAQRPEELFKEKNFMFYLTFVICVVIFLLLVDFPIFHWFLN